MQTTDTTEREIFALSVTHKAGNETVWCFDLASEYCASLNVLQDFGINHTAFHDRANIARPVPCTARELSDTEWLSLSAGCNDHQELLRCLTERGDF